MFSGNMKSKLIRKIMVTQRHVSVSSKGSWQNTYQLICARFHMPDFMQYDVFVNIVQKAHFYARTGQTGEDRASQWFRCGASLYFYF